MISPFETGMNLACNKDGVLVGNTDNLKAFGIEINMTNVDIENIFENPNDIHYFKSSDKSIEINTIKDFLKVVNIDEKYIYSVDNEVVILQHENYNFMVGLHKKNVSIY